MGERGQAMKPRTKEIPVDPQTKEKDARSKEDRERHEHLSEEQIDKTLKDSFPASDPPSWY